jgi:hypothetical protein
MGVTNHIGMNGVKPEEEYLRKSVYVRVVVRE